MCVYNITFNTEKLNFSQRVYLNIPYVSHSKQLMLPYTPIGFLMEGRCVLCEVYTESLNTGLVSIYWFLPGLAMAQVVSRRPLTVEAWV